MYSLTQPSQIEFSTLLLCSFLICVIIILKFWALESGLGSQLSVTSCENWAYYLHLSSHLKTEIMQLNGDSSTTIGKWVNSNVVENGAIGCVLKLCLRK